MKYTHRSDGILARCICDDALHNGVRKKVWLFKMPDSENEVVDFTDMFNASCFFNRKYVERTQWDDVKVDTPIWVYIGNRTPLRRHFAKSLPDGRACYFGSGRTSHTCDIEDIQTQASEVFVSLTPVAAKDLPWNK